MFEVDEGGFESVLDRERPERVAILADDHSVQIKQCLGRIRRAQQAMAAACRRRGLPVFVAGPDVSDRPAEHLAAGASAAFVGDPTLALVEWAEGRRDLLGLHGEGGPGGRRPVITDLDNLPLPAWELVDLAQYARRWRARHGHWEMNVWTARGCPFRCNWCAKPTWGRSYHVRSAEAVAAEISLLRARYQPDRLWFTDDIFGLRPAWLRAFRVAIEAAGAPPLPYRCLSRADLLQDPAVVDDLAASGCDRVWIGAESGADTVLRRMDKDGTVAEIRRATENLHRRGVAVGFFLQLGYPGETLADVRSTIDLVRTLRPDEIGVSVSYPLPNTVFYERVRDHLLGTSWEASMENRTLFPAPYPQPFYDAAKELLRSTHSGSRADLALRALVQRPGRQSARRMVGAVYHRLRAPWMERQLTRLAVPNPDAVTLPG
jgi:radical SAM superfamily enzyme YgiQ (UPF0313 family)